MTRASASRLAAALALILSAAGMAAARGGAVALPDPVGVATEVVVANVDRPIQLAFDGEGRLVVLAHGRGDAAGEILRLDLHGTLPVDGSRSPRVVIPFSDTPRKAAFGSLAVDRSTGHLYLGEENGNRVYRLSAESRLTAVAVGLQHLVGGSSIALDSEARLLVLDFASPETQGRAEAPPPRGLDVLGPDRYQGPMVFRVALGDGVALPRRLDLVPPIFPRGWLPPPGEPPTRFMSVAALPGGDAVVLDSIGELLRLTFTGELHRVARLPAGHYHRTSLAVAADGALLVSSGFHVRRIFRVSPTGMVTTVANELGDPGGVAIDDLGRIYVAETAFHRVIRLTNPPPSPR